MRSKSTLLSLSVLLVVLLVGGASGAVAGAMITGRQIKDGTVTGRDIKNGSLAAYDLAPAARQALRGSAGAPGVSNWQMVQAASPSVAGSTLFQSVDATCPAGTKLLSATARWHTYNQNQIALSYYPNGTGAHATSNDGSPQDVDNIDLTLICATVMP